MPVKIDLYSSIIRDLDIFGIILIKYDTPFTEMILTSGGGYPNYGFVQSFAGIIYGESGSIKVVCNSIRLLTKNIVHGQKENTVQNNTYSDGYRYNLIKLYSFAFHFIASGIVKKPDDHSGT